MKILFIGKKNDTNTQLASEYVRQIFPETQVVFGSRDEQFPVELFSWRGDYIFSYLSPWIIPKSLLETALFGAINWHPGPLEYPGIGCTNFAIYNGEKEFGITCHYMLDKVDTGEIIEVKKFSILENDTVFSVTQKCYVLILNSFFRTVEKIANGTPLPKSTDNWKRKPYTRKELNNLTEVKPDMSLEEIEKRIKATTYDKPWAYLELYGKRFFLKE
jgi:methionyl-tRNA formyltransferase